MKNSMSRARSAASSKAKSSASNQIRKSITNTRSAVKQSTKPVASPGKQ